MAGEAGHAAIAVGELREISRHRAPTLAIFQHGLGQARFFAVVGIAGRDGVFHLHYFPLQALSHARALIEPPIFPIEAELLPGRAHALHVGTTGRRCRSAGDEGGVLGDVAVAIHALDLDSITRAAVELAIAVDILIEVAVGAVHALIHVDVAEVHCLAEFFRIVGGNDLAARIQHIAAAITLEDLPEDPAVTVEVIELRVLQLGIKFRRAGIFQKSVIVPQSFGGRAFRVGDARLA